MDLLPHTYPWPTRPLPSHVTIVTVLSHLSLLFLNVNGLCASKGPWIHISYQRGWKKRQYTNRVIIQQSAGSVGVDTVMCMCFSDCTCVRQMEREREGERECAIAMKLMNSITRLDMKPHLILNAVTEWKLRGQKGLPHIYY